MYVGFPAGASGAGIEENVLFLVTKEPIYVATLEEYSSRTFG